MGIVFRQSFKASVVMLAGALLGAFTNWLFTFILLKQQLGLQRNVVNYAAIIQLVALLGIPQAIQTFVPRFAAGSDKRRVLLRIGVLAPLLSVALFSVGYYVLRDQVIGFFQPQDQPLFRQFYHLMPPMVLAWCYLTLLDVYLVTHHKTALASFAREIIMRVAMLASLLLYYFGVLSFSGFMWSLLGMAILPALFLLPVAMRTGTFGVRGAWTSFSKKEYRGIGHFAWYHLLTGLSLTLLGLLDTQLLTSLDSNGFESAAVYSIAAFLAALAVAPYRAMTNAAFPTLNEAYSSGNLAQVKSLFNRSSINILIVGIFMCALIAVNLHNAALIFNKGYEAIVPITLILLLGRLVDMATGLNESLISISPLYRFNFRVSLALVALMVLFCVLLIPHYGMYGAAWATTLALALFNIAKAIFLYKKMELWPFTSGSWKVVAAGAIAGAAGWLLPHLPSGEGWAHYAWVLADAALRSTVVIGVYIALILWWKPSADIGHFIAGVKKRLGR